MLIELTTDRVVDWGLRQFAGDRIELPDVEANRLIEAGQAMPVGKIVETTTLRAPENTMLRQGERRPR